jgi:hypothetical protein
VVFLTKLRAEYTQEMHVTIQFRISYLLALLKVIFIRTIKTINSGNASYHPVLFPLKVIFNTKINHKKLRKCVLSFSPF